VKPRAKSKSTASVGDSRREDSLANAFAKAHWSLKDLPIHHDALAADGKELLGALDRVRSYRAFLVRARRAKAGGSPAIDPLVYAEARTIQQDAAIATNRAARIMRTLHVSGACTQLTGSMAKSLKVSGPIKLKALLTRVRVTACRPCLLRYGVRDPMLEEFGAALAQTDLTIAADGLGVKVNGTANGKRVRGRIAARRHIVGLPRDPLDLLNRGRFLALCDSLERGEAAYLLGTGPQREPFSLEDLLMTDTLAGQREAGRHVRKLEDLGLATYAGGAEAVLIGLLAIAIIGLIIAAKECDEKTPSGEDTDDCKLGKALALLGTGVLLALGAGSDSKPTNLNTTGGLSISGPLPQLQT
jgi:hypothetical protein